MDGVEDRLGPHIVPQIRGPCDETATLCKLEDGKWTIGMWKEGGGEPNLRCPFFFFYNDLMSVLFQHYM